VHGLGRQAAAVDPAFLAPREQSGLFEDAQVPGDRGSRDVERLGEVADGRFGLRQAREDRAAGRVGEGAERPVESGRIVNH
jgi:hypothetical protein